MSIESKVYLDLARIWNVGPGEVEKMVRDYIGAVTCNFKPLQTYPKPHICIRPIKVKTLKQRLEEATMHEDCYFCIKRDICTKDVPKPCNYKYTEDERKAAQASDQYGAILNDTYLPNAYRKKKKEEQKMNATSTENFHDVIAIDLELQTFPNPDVQDKFIVSATNRDDIFCFVFEGPHIGDACRKAGLFTGWEKDQKIRKLGKENKNLNKCINALKSDLDLTKAANEAQRKFIKEYAGNDTEVTFNYAIGSGPITYGLYDKDYIDKLRKEIHDLIAENTELKTKLHDTAKEGDYVYLGSIPYSADDIKKLKEQIKKLEQLKTPTIENFADEKPSDNVNHPSHYTGRYECIDVMQDVFGDEATDNFCLCNAFKYIWRARKKNGLEDVKKAVWYLNKYIEEAEKDGVSKGEQI